MALDLQERVDDLILHKLTSRRVRPCFANIGSAYSVAYQRTTVENGGDVVAKIAQSFVDQVDR